MVKQTRRDFLAGAGATLALLATAGAVHAEPSDARWIANHMDARLFGADGQAVAWIPRWSRMRLMRGLGNGWLQVWVPRLDMVGRVQESAVGPVPVPSE